MVPDNLNELILKLRQRIATMEATIRDTEQASQRSQHTEKALRALRESLKSAKTQLAQAEQLLKKSS